LVILLSIAQAAFAVAKVGSGGQITMINAKRKFALVKTLNNQNRSASTMKQLIVLFDTQFVSLTGLFKFKIKRHHFFNTKPKLWYG
jgi:hypothetical protein